MDKIRCSNCRGAKQVAKLGGMLGDCNLCLGTGLITAQDKPVAVVAQSLPMTDAIIKATANIAAIQINKPMNEVISDAVVNTAEPVIDKPDGKKAIYKRKSASK